MALLCMTERELATDTQIRKARVFRSLEWIDISFSMSCRSFVSFSSHLLNNSYTIGCYYDDVERYSTVYLFLLIVLS